MKRDKYPNFAALARAEPARDFSISVRDKGTFVAIAAPHGGGIELGTSEITLAVAGDDLSYYLFEGNKAKGNREYLHITSSNFDEPQCLNLLRVAHTVLTVHGEGSKHEVVYLGGLDEVKITGLSRTLSNYGFTVGKHSDPELQGVHPNNICNIGRSGAGVQLELSEGLRKLFFASLDRASRRQPTRRLDHFSKAIREVLFHNG